MTLAAAVQLWQVNSQLAAAVQQALATKTGLANTAMKTQNTQILTLDTNLKNIHGTTNLISTEAASAGTFFAGWESAPCSRQIKGVDSIIQRIMSFATGKPIDAGTDYERHGKTGRLIPGDIPDIWDTIKRRQEQQAAGVPEAERIYFPPHQKTMFLRNQGQQLTASGYTGPGLRLHPQTRRLFRRRPQSRIPSRRLHSRQRAPETPGLRRRRPGHPHRPCLVHAGEHVLPERTVRSLGHRALSNLSDRSHSANPSYSDNRTMTFNLPPVQLSGKLEYDMRALARALLPHLTEELKAQSAAPPAGSCVMTTSVSLRESPCPSYSGFSFSL